MDESRKRNIIVAVAFLLPILFIVVIVAITYIPSVLLKTDYNFLYATCDDEYRYDCNIYLNNVYGVKDGKIMINQIDPNADFNYNEVKDINENIKTRIFLYDTKTETSREITPAEAEKLNLSELATSPDGVSVSSGYDYNESVFFFGGGSQYGQYLVKGKNRREINLIGNNDYYYNRNFKFVGWILK